MIFLFPFVTQRYLNNPKQFICLVLRVHCRGSGSWDCERTYFKNWFLFICGNINSEWCKSWIYNAVINYIAVITISEIATTQTELRSIIWSWMESVYKTIHLPTKLTVFSFRCLMIFPCWGSKWNNQPLRATFRTFGELRFSQLISSWISQWVKQCTKLWKP